jgi:hypothetical protein
MAVSFYLYTTYLQRLLRGDALDLTTATLKVSLHQSGYSVDRDLHDFFDDVTNEVPAAGGYTTGGQALTGVTVSQDGAGHFAFMDADDSVWAGATFTARYAVLRDAAPALAADQPLIGYIDFGANVQPIAEEFRISYAASTSGGVVRVG